MREREREREREFSSQPHHMVACDEDFLFYWDLEVWVVYGPPIVMFSFIYVMTHIICVIINHEAVIMQLVDILWTLGHSRTII